MQSYSNLIYKIIPSLRFLIAIAIGIILQYHLQISISILLFTFLGACLLWLIFSFLSIPLQFKYAWCKGIIIHILFIAVGGCLSFAKQIENNPNWIGKYFKNDTPVLVSLQENVVDKGKSYKVLVSAKAVKVDEKWQPCSGDVLLYFRKDSIKPNLHFGDQIIITNHIVNIINSGNPGGFNYARYCSFQNISFQAFLTKNDYIKIDVTQKNSFTGILISLKTFILKTLKNNIKNKDELSIAEALLIGYRDELDRDLVRAYSNTGVVHIIAISGLHLGMIYGLLVWLFISFKKYKWSKIVKFITIIIVLWMFSFIAGLPPSILRSAIMFSCIAFGDVFFKKSNIYNGLSISALIILIYNPFSLWDVGFQLSYAAVLSIVLFSGSIQKLVYFKNKLLLVFWNVNAITLSAQILTLPVVLYHFHQFPNLFLFTNLFAVPLSGLVLYAEIILMFFVWFKSFALIIGLIIEKLIRLLNVFVLSVNELPFATWENIQISIVQSILLYLFLIAIAYWWFNKKKKYLLVGFAFLLLFFGIRTIDFLKKNNQQKLIVYNVPSHTAMDIIEGRNAFFIGDDDLMQDGFLRNFHIKPSRTLHRVQLKNKLNTIRLSNNIIQSKQKNILIISDTNLFVNTRFKYDAVILTKNPRISLIELYSVTKCQQYVFDGSNSFWKINQWKKEADSLHLQLHICSVKGAFELNL